MAANARTMRGANSSMRWHPRPQAQGDFEVSALAASWASRR